MQGRWGQGRRPLPSTASASSPLVPCVLLRKGEICLPTEDGPVPARTSNGERYDPFEVVDGLSADFPLIYLVDLDGVERAEPQLDFLQELARDATLWVDGGVRNADQAIDILITGAQRAVLSSAMLLGLKELRRSWRLSTELIFELELDAGGLVAPGQWDTNEPVEFASAVRAVGVDHLVVSPREITPDWGLVRALAAGGPTWVNGSFEESELPQLRESGARGGIFHIGRRLQASIPAPDSSSPLPSASQSVRDDET